MISMKRKKKKRKESKKQMKMKVLVTEIFLVDVSFVQYLYD